MWTKESNGYFCKVEHFAYGEINQRGLVTPTSKDIIQKGQQNAPTRCQCLGYHSCGHDGMNDFTTFVQTLFILPTPSLSHWGWDKMNAISQTIFSKFIFLKENVSIAIKISLKFVPKGPINNIPSLVQIMAWRHPRDKPLSETMMVRLPTHICVTRPQWVRLYNYLKYGHFDRFTYLRF